MSKLSYEDKPNKKKKILSYKGTIGKITNNCINYYNYDRIKGKLKKL